MKLTHYKYSLRSVLLLTVFLISSSIPVKAQEDEEAQKAKKETTPKPVKSTFESIFLFDNQTTLVPAKGTFEMDIQHRFGTVNKGYDDFYGLYAPSNIRIGFAYSPIDRLYAGLGFAKINMTWDFTAKYAIYKQMKDGGSPVAVTYFGNVAIDSRDAENFVNPTDRFSYFNQIIVSRKVTEALSVQMAPGWSHFNAVEGYINEEGKVVGKMKNDHFSVSFGGRYKVSGQMAIIVNYDQPITKHTTNNPEPNISLGIEVSTSSHAFQVFAGNGYNIIPQLNAMYNQNNYREGQFLIGFNITRLWNF
jgi:hypothetical protein